MHNNPEISVIIPVYNGERYISESIKSILKQSFSNFEIIIIDDGSTDNTYSIIELHTYKDPRIQLYRNSSNLGVAVSLNKSLGLARSPLIARMDADDIAYPNRLNSQYEFMKSHPEVSVCGSALSLYEQPDQIWYPPITHDEIKTRLLFECSLYHPTVIFRKEIVLDQLGGYIPQFSGAEDFDLWQRASQFSNIKFANISEPLLFYRIHKSVDRREYKSKQHKLANLIRRNQLKRLGLDPNNSEFKCHEALSCPNSAAFEMPNLKDCLNWLNQLELGNQKNHVFLSNILRCELNKRWLHLCLQTSYQSPTTALHYLKWHSSFNHSENIYQMTRMVWRSRKYWTTNND